MNPHEPFDPHQKRSNQRRSGEQPNRDPRPKFGQNRQGRPASQGGDPYSRRPGDQYEKGRNPQGHKSRKAPSAAEEAMDAGMGRGGTPAPGGSGGSGSTAKSSSWGCLVMAIPLTGGLATVVIWLPELLRGLL